MEFKVKKISYFYNDNDIILQNITIAAKKGDSLSISGLNGSGKTTLLKLLSGFIKPMSIPGWSEPAVRSLRATIPAIQSHLELPSETLFHGALDMSLHGICI